MTMHGIDVSDFQDIPTIQSWLPKIDFGFVKATEGHTLRLSGHAPRVDVFRGAGKHVAHYHYAWPENGGAVDAANFLSFVNAQPGDILALDFEPFHSSAPVSEWPQYVVDFANECHKAHGVWTALYSEDFHLGKLMAACNSQQASFIRNLPEWKAGSNNGYFHQATAPAFQGDTHGWADVSFWQWTDQPLDQDEFYGDATAWAKLALGGTPGAPAPSRAPVPSSSRGSSRPPLPTPAPASHATTYTVRPGDSLSIIAGRYRVTVADLVAWNHIANPNLIYPGQVLTIGHTVAGTVRHVPTIHTVVVGDTLGAISARYHVPVSTLVAWNHIANPNLIFPGQRLRVS